jgi:hypothetical protein
LTNFIYLLNLLSAKLFDIKVILGGTVLITKAIVQSISADGTRCKVRMPLFESSASSAPIEAEALVNIAPGVFNNIEVGDRVFIGFEENAMEKPIILGKLFRGADVEGRIRGGGGVFNTLKVSSDAVLPAATSFTFPASAVEAYKDLKTFKNIADYIKWLESFTKKNITQIEDNFNCFKNWTQWQFKPENVEIDDGDIDSTTEVFEPFQYQEEGKTCKICSTCTKDSTRRYRKLSVDTNYPNN